jgi:hypothetical protein
MKLLYLDGYALSPTEVVLFKNKVKMRLFPQKKPYF